MRVVVTGASGSIAAHCLRHLAGHDVELVPVARREWPGARRVRDYRDAPPGDVLLHLAEERDRSNAAALGAAYESAAVETAAVLRRRYARVVYASSGALYGDAAVLPRRPADPVAAGDAYTRIKLGCEQAVLATPGGTVARIANVYGPGMAATNVVSAILRQVPGRGPLRVTDTRAVRDFVWVDDVAAALVAMVMSGAEGILNVGTGIGTSIGRLGELALVLAGQDGRSPQSTNPGATASTLVLDIAATTAALHWRPATELAAGLRRLLDDAGGRP